MESKVNPQHDKDVITAKYVSGYEPTYFILSDNLSEEERKEYQLVIKDELTPRFKDQLIVE